MGSNLFKRGLLPLALVLALLPATALSSRESRGSIRAQMIFWNVGQGDFMTLVSPQNCLIFDTGGSPRAIPIKALELLSRTCPKSKTSVFFSHFDKDHIGNFWQLLPYVKISGAFLSHLDPQSKTGQRLLETLKKSHSQITEARRNSSLEKLSLNADGSQLPNFSLRILWPNNIGPLKHFSENDRSLVVLLTYNEKRILFTGDLSSKVENKIEDLRPVDILKVGHHGSRSSTSFKFLERLKPKSCVVSVGKHNSYGHPTPETLERLRQAHCATLRTDLLGNIIFDL